MGYCCRNTATVGRATRKRRVGLTAEISCSMGSDLRISVVPRGTLSWSRLCVPHTDTPIDADGGQRRQLCVAPGCSGVSNASSAGSSDRCTTWNTPSLSSVRPRAFSAAWLDRAHTVDSRRAGRHRFTSRGLREVFSCNSDDDSLNNAIGRVHWFLADIAYASLFHVEHWRRTIF